MTKFILAILALVLGACTARVGEAASSESSTVTDVLPSTPPSAARAELKCVTNYTRCVSSPDRFQNEGCWSLETCNAAPTDSTMACQAVGAPADGHYFCTWDVGPTGSQ